jgi:hypothetical protein
MAEYVVESGVPQEFDPHASHTIGKRDMFTLLYAISSTLFALASLFWGWRCLRRDAKKMK